MSWVHPGFSGDLGWSLLSPTVGCLAWGAQCGHPGQPCLLHCVPRAPFLSPSLQSSDLRVSPEISPSPAWSSLMEMVLGEVWLTKLGGWPKTGTTHVDQDFPLGGNAGPRRLLCKEFWLHMTHWWGAGRWGN